MWNCEHSTVWLYNWNYSLFIINWADALIFIPNESDTEIKITQQPQ